MKRLQVNQNEMKDYYYILELESSAIQKEIEISIRKNSEVLKNIFTWVIPKKSDLNKYLISGIVIIIALLSSFYYESHKEPNSPSNELSKTSSLKKEGYLITKDSTKYFPKKIEDGINLIERYYKTFSSYQNVETIIQQFYNSILLDYHGSKYINSEEAKIRDLKDFKDNNIRSYQITIDKEETSYIEEEYYYLIRTKLKYEIIRNNNVKSSVVLPISIALTKDVKKILAIAKKLDPNIINSLIDEDVKVNIDNSLYYKKGINDPNVIAIRNMIDDHLNNSHNKNIELEAGVVTSLNSFEFEYFTGKFMLGTIEDAKYGGKWATILFIDKPDKVFFVWIYNQRIKAFGDSKLNPKILNIIKIDLNTFDKRYGF